MKGTVKKFDKEKGYGFITGEDGKDYFFHYSQLVRDGFKTAEIGQKVEFDEAKTEKAIADQTLAALTIMIAESQPAEKEMMISVIMNCMIK